MKNMHFFNPLKFDSKNKCNHYEEEKKETKVEEIKAENPSQDILKLNFHLFDIDQVFEN